MIRMCARALLVVFLAAIAPIRADVAASLSALEAERGGRLGVAAVDTGSGARAGHRVDERFALCSTFKLLLAAAVLARVDAGEETLDRRLSYGAADLLSYAPVARAHVAEGGMTVGDLCAAAVQMSDNTAANLLLATVGGPKGLTRWLRSIGDKETRLDRIEPELNANLPGDERDTTTPGAMAETMRALLLGKVLSASSREALTGWLVGCTTGDRRLRAGFGPERRTGDKTGTGERGAANDVGIVWPGEGDEPWLVAAYYANPEAEPAKRDEVIAEAARIVAGAFLQGKE